MNRIIHVKITSDEPKKITDFYKKAFKWQVDKFPEPPDGWRMSSGTGFGINSSVYRAEDSPLDKHIALAISVDSIEYSKDKIIEAGGSVAEEQIEAFGNRYLYCYDPDGNVICLVQFSD